MTRKEKGGPRDEPPVRSLLRLEPFLLIAAVLSVVALGWWSRQQLRQTDHYVIPFTAIDCTPPPDQARTELLAEVQYLANLPDQVNLLDEGLSPRLTAAFARHPWIEGVERVQVGPARQVRVWLRYRQPVLVVPPPANAQSTEPRVVDGNAIVLPPRAAPRGLPRYVGSPAAPPGPAGTAWPDPRVQEAAAVARVLAPHQTMLRLFRCEPATNGLVWLTDRGTRVVWPGGAGNAAAEKVQRLLQHCQQHGDLDHPEGIQTIDLPQ